MLLTSVPPPPTVSQGYDVKVDESSLTGEGDLAKKGIERDRMLYAGTQVSWRIVGAAIFGGASFLCCGGAECAGVSQTMCNDKLARVAADI